MRIEDDSLRERRRVLSEAFAILRQNGIDALSEHLCLLDLSEAILPQKLSNRLESLASFIMGYDPTNALLLCDRAIAIDPQTVPAWLMRGGICDQIGNHSESLRSVLHVVETLNASPEQKIRASDLLVRMGKDELALQTAKTAYKELNEPLNHAQTLMYIALRTADWELVDSLMQQMGGAYERGEYRSVNESPRTNLLWCPNEYHNVKVTENWSKSALPLPSMPIRHNLVFPKDRRIRVGYLSSDFREHPTSRLINGLFRHHDRQKFEIFLYCSGWDDGSAMRREIESHCDHVYSVTDLDNAHAAKMIKEHGIDVLVELNGPTRSNRMGILAYRPAPVQIDYMGWPGSVGGRVVDYIIADEYTLPEGQERLYPEKVIRIKEIYQINDYAKQTLGVTPDRGDFSLPEGMKVLGMFNAINKVRNEVWDVWMEIMRRSPDTVLWLLDPGAAARTHIGKAAYKARVDPKRIIIAPKMKQDDHLARLALCDVMLDPWPYGGHTSTSDALFAGVPVVAMKGENFAGRVSGGLLKAAGLEVLIAENPKEYVAIAMKIVENPSYLSELKSFIRQQVPKNDIFNAKSKTRQFESGYIQALQRVCEGLELIHLYGYQKREVKGLKPDSPQCRLWTTGLLPDMGFRVSGGNDIRVANVKSKIVENDEWKLYAKIPYCIDYQRREIVYALGIDPYRAFESTFHYQYLRTNAKSYLSVPWSIRRGEEKPLVPLKDPVFIFSPGRCGSTLLSHLFRQMGIATVSEPDIYINAALFHTENPAFEKKSAEILRQVSDDLLSGVKNTPIAIKLRSNANHNPARIVGICNERPKTVFIIRDFLPWAHSRMRAFSNDMQSNIGIYIQSLQAYGWLRDNTECLLLRYEELTAENSDLLHRIGDFFDIQIDIDQLKEVFAHDSQKGTKLETSKIKGELSEETRGEIVALWEKHAPKSLLKSLDLNYLITSNLEKK